MYNNTAEDASALIWAPKTFVGRTKVNCFLVISSQQYVQFNIVSSHSSSVIGVRVFAMLFKKREKKEMYR